MGSYNVGVVVGQGDHPGGIAVVEFLDDWKTRNLPRRHAIRDVIAVRSMPTGLSIAQSVEKVAEAAAEQGPDARVVFNTASSREVYDNFRDAYREEKFARRPLAVNVTMGDGGLTSDEWGTYSVTGTELTLALTERVRTRGFTFPRGIEGVEDLITEAMRAEAEQTSSGKVRLVPRQPTARLVALALALYPAFAPGHDGRRFRSQALPTNPPRTFESFAAAEAALGQAARG